MVGIEGVKHERESKGRKQKSLGDNRLYYNYIVVVCVKSRVIEGEIRGGTDWQTDQTRFKYLSDTSFSKYRVRLSQARVTETGIITLFPSVTTSVIDFWSDGRREKGKEQRTSKGKVIDYRGWERVWTTQWKGEREGNHRIQGRGKVSRCERWMITLIHWRLPLLSCSSFLLSPPCFVSGVDLCVHVCPYLNITCWCRYVWW